VTINGSVSISMSRSAVSVDRLLFSTGRERDRRTKQSRSPQATTRLGDSRRRNAQLASAF
jgi:hypothetical protein